MSPTEAAIKEGGKKEEKTKEQKGRKVTFSKKNITIQEHEKITGQVIPMIVVESPDTSGKSE